MSDAFSLERLIALVQAPDAAPPRVDPVEAHVRSGVQFVFRDPLKRGVPAAIQDTLNEACFGQKQWMLGTFVFEWGYEVRRESVAKFHSWLANHEAALVQFQPEGVRYRGTYAVFSTTEKKSGNYRTIWTFNDFGGMQNFGQDLSSGTPFAQLVGDLVAFFDRDYGAGSSQQIYQPAQGTLSTWQLVGQVAIQPGSTASTSGSSPYP